MNDKEIRFTKGFLCLIAMALDGVMRFSSVKTSTLNLKKVSSFVNSRNKPSRLQLTVRLN